MSLARRSRTHRAQPSVAQPTRTIGHLVPQVYEQLLAAASKKLREQPLDHAFDSTALVHEAYLRLVRYRGQWTGKAHLRRAMARAMDCVLIDMGRRKSSRQRRFPWWRWREHGDSESFEDLYGELHILSKVRPRLYQVVKLRFFEAMTTREIAKTTRRSERTVESDWALARAWLRDRLSF